jgi:hypothetical protein
VKRGSARLLAVAASVAFVLFGTVYALGANDPEADSAEVTAQATYEVYWLGRSFEGLKLTGTFRRLEKPGPGEKFGADFTTYLYGTCKPRGSDGGCALPLEIQSWAACKRNLSVYSVTPDGRPLPHKRTTIRGVPAAIFEDGLRLEVYTGKTTVVLFGYSGPQLRRAANVMRSVSGKVGPGDPLPPPAPGALTGGLSC